MTTMMTTMMTTYLYWLRSSLSSASVSNDISGFMVATRSRCYVRQGACGYTCNTRERRQHTRWRCRIHASAANDGGIVKSARVRSIKPPWQRATRVARAR